MAIERALEQGPLPISGVEEEDIEIEVVNPESVSVETEDGGMLIDFRSESEVQEEVEFGANLAETMGESELGRLSSE